MQIYGNALGCDETCKSGVKICQIVFLGIALKLLKLYPHMCAAFVPSTKKDKDDSETAERSGYQSIDQNKHEYKHVEYQQTTIQYHNGETPAESIEEKDTYINIIIDMIVTILIVHRWTLHCNNR